jgi:UDP-N-acetylglucosamine 2-epimerase (non-hydrolysing)
MKISIILGTRPEVIKFSPIIRECKTLGQDFYILHTGQHYTYCMDRVFFEQLDLPGARYNLDVGSGSHGEQTGKMLTGIEKILQKEPPDMVLVEGDTNTVLAGALSAVKLGITVGHVEAGLRSYDREMPEEINRILTDHCSDLLFAPTEKSKRTLLAEGIPGERVSVTGNTIVDAVIQNMSISGRKARMNETLEIGKGGYFLSTIHRQENVDNRQRFKDIMIGLELVSRKTGLPIIYPIHPRAKKQLNNFKISTHNIKIIEPLDYLSFLQLECKAKLILTDSGGIQEEACILGIPCVTLRYNTERPETLEVGANVLAGTKPEEILEKTEFMLGRKNRWKNPFGDGKAGKTIVQIIKEKA